MFKLDNNFLIELGLGALPADEKNKMLAHIYETLEMRVGMKLAEQMTDAQLDEFESYINRNDEAGALKWLESNFPNYKDVVAAELEKLKNEIKAVAPQIVTESMNNVREEFQRLKKLFDKCSGSEASNLKFQTLSMGMSSDYKIAVEEGSTMVRIGSLLFGARNQN